MRIQWIDNAKGIAIFLVILGHVSGDLTGIWDFGFVYGIHLVMFFLLSGYLIKKRDITREWINAKFSRLMVPYFLTCFVIIITDVINSIILNYNGGGILTITKIIGRDIIRSYFASGSIKYFGSIDIGTRIGAIWFLPAMFFAILIFEFLLSYIDDDKRLGVFSGAIMMMGYIIGRFLWLPFSFCSGMFAVFFLYIGYEIKKYSILDKIKWYHYLLAQIILLWGIYNNYCNIGFVVAYMNDIIISIPVGLSGCLLIYGISVGLKNRCAILSYIGRLSLIVLCVHLYALETLWSHFRYFFDILGLSGNIRTWVNIGMNIVAPVIIASIICFLEKKIKELPLNIYDKRNASIDITRGIFILALLTSYFSIDANLRTIIYSCHMEAFVILSGICYKDSISMKAYLKKHFLGLLMPYLVFIGLVILKDYELWSYVYFRDILIKYLFGISFTNNLFVSIPSVGPVYFLLMLFVVEIVYYFIDHQLKDVRYKWVVVLCLSVFGAYLGKSGFWLPWSIDIALYSLIFYQIGVAFRKYDILYMIKENHITYFLLSSIWAYMIFKGGMEIAIRKYGSYGITILGAVAGVLVVYKLAAYIADHVTILRDILSFTGRTLIIVIIILSLLKDSISKILTLRFDPDYIPFMIAMILIELIIAFAVRWLIDRIRNIL